jgi:hypothetical protein
MEVSYRISFDKAEFCLLCYESSCTPHGGQNFRIIYFPYVHSLLPYDIILWSNSSHSYSVFRMQKHVLRIMTKSGYSNSCRQLFKNWGILPFYSQYIFSLMLFVVRNTHLYITNQETHGVNTRHNTDFHFPTVRLTAFK